MAQLNTGNEILVDVDELQRQYKITTGVNECFSKEFQTWKMKQKNKANPDYLCLAVFAVFFFFPFGMCATYYANSANKSRQCGNYEEAREKNHTAIGLIIAAYSFGVIGAFIIGAMHLT
ncbi:transmembrane protein PMIS2-like [Mytilus trossulus]|uniref:transmembrane protein PMIS2-like n=1 Tax=Mytilus trossulus TaxID=6551 RepID=UPI0030076C05